MDALLTFVGENFHVLLISLPHINRHNNQDNSIANGPPNLFPLIYSNYWKIGPCV